MPKHKPARRRVTASSRKRPQIMPFSLELPRSEMDALRRIAGKEGVSIAAVVRRAILIAVASAHPELGREIVEAEADAFFDQLGARFATGRLTAAKRKAFKARLVRLLG